MNLVNEQKILYVNNSSVLQAKGDININNGVSVETAMEICKYVVRSELAIYTQQAEIEAQKRLSDISEKTIDRITSLKEDLLQRFNEPAIQIALNETFKNYIASGDEILGENLIDLLIERLNVKEKSTEQALIDEARNIIPKLSSATVALLTFLVFSRLIFPYDKQKYDSLILKLAPLSERLNHINSLDIAYLKQVGCGTGISAFKTVSSLEKSLLSKYDLFFRHGISLNTFKNVISKFPHLLNSLSSNDMEYVIGLLNFGANNVSFNVNSTNRVKEIYNENKKEYLLPIFEELKSESIPFSEDDVRVYHIQKDNRWRYAFDLFKKDEISSFILNPIGIYIGLRQLTQICGEPIPMSVFYK